MQRTDEQIAIVDAFEQGESVAIHAYAGAGKSTALRLCAQSAPERRGVYLAFNKSISVEAQQTFPASCRCLTVHGLAMREVGYQYAHRLNGPRVTSRQVAEVLGISRWLKLGIVLLSPAKLARMALDTLTRFCYSDDTEVSRRHVPWVDGLDDHRDELCEMVVPWARTAWADVSSHEGRLAHTHDHYLKIYSLSDPTINCDYLLGDEFQDSSAVIAHIFECQDDVQLALCADRFQQIYSWRGSANVIDRFDIGCQLHLSQSFRFGDEISVEANRWLDRLGAEVPLRGSSWVQSSVGPVESPRAVLCRTNAAVVAEVMAQQASGRQPGVVGGTGPIVSFAEAAIELRAGKGTWHHDLQGFKDWSQVQNYTSQDHGGQDLRTFVRIIDSYGAEMVIAVMNNCLPESAAEILVSTAHKVKGKEFESVRLADDFQVQPREDKKTGEMRDPPDEELRLAYVACTRAQHQLDVSGLYTSASAQEGS